MFERSDAANGHSPILALHANPGSGKAAIEGQPDVGKTAAAAKA
jgi:hypothetical protein